MIFVVASETAFFVYAADPEEPVSSVEVPDVILSSSDDDLSTDSTNVDACLNCYSPAAEGCYNFCRTCFHSQDLDARSKPQKKVCAKSCSCFNYHSSLCKECQSITQSCFMCERVLSKKIMCWISGNYYCSTCYERSSAFEDSDSIFYNKPLLPLIDSNKVSVGYPCLYGGLKKFLVSQLSSSFPKIKLQELEDLLSKISYQIDSWPQENCPESTRKIAVLLPSVDDQKRFFDELSWLKSQVAYGFDYGCGHPDQYDLPISSLTRNVQSLREPDERPNNSTFCQGLCLALHQSYWVDIENGPSDFAAHLLLLSQKPEDKVYFNYSKGLKEAVAISQEKYRRYAINSNRNSFFQCFRQQEPYAFNILESHAFLHQLLYRHQRIEIDRPSIGKSHPKGFYPDMLSWQAHCLGLFQSWIVTEQLVPNLSTHSPSSATFSDMLFDDFSKVIEFLENIKTIIGFFIFQTGVLYTDELTGTKFAHDVALLVRKEDITLFDISLPYYFVQVSWPNRYAIADYILWSLPSVDKIIFLGDENTTEKVKKEFYSYQLDFEG